MFIYRNNPISGIIQISLNFMYDSLSDNQLIIVTTFICFINFILLLFKCIHFVMMHIDISLTRI